MADCFPNPTNIVSWWPGDGTAVDVAGGNNGAFQGGATAGAAGMVANAFSFDGTNGYVQVPDSPALRPTNLTIEAWVRFTGLDSAGNAGAGQQYIVFKQNTRSSDFEGFALSKTRLAGGDVFNFAVTSSSGQAVDVSSSTLVTTGIWYHVAGLRGSNFLQIYVNGQLQRQTNVTFAQNYGTLPLFFGSSGQSFWDGKLKGNLDEVTLYNRALTSNEIAAVFAAGAAGKCKSVSISTQPASQTASIGSNVTFLVAATGFGSLGYRWQFNGANISGATNPNLILTNIQTTNAGDYAAVVTNSLSSATSAVAVLTVNVPPAITVLPVSQTTNESAAASFSVTAVGTAPLSYQWRKADVLLNGQTSNVLAFSVVTTNDAGTYDVVVSNVAGSVTSTPPALLTVNVPPVITVFPASQTTNEGAAVSFSVAATGTAPLSYQWRKAREPLNGQTSNVLAFSIVTTNDAGSYDVVVSNVAGSVTSTPPASLTVYELNIPPVIVVPPQSQATNLGSAVTFNVTVTGTAPLSYQWHKDGSPISAETSNILAFSSVTTNDAGSYDVVVTNTFGSVTSSPPAFLIVNVPPVITVSPTNQTTNEGAAASFIVAATGTAPLSYQWRKAGVPLSGQTNDVLAFAVVTTNDAGSYDVVVSNVAGSVTSSPPALLSVNVPPVITVLPTNQTTNEGAAASFSVAATGTAPLNYQWRKAGVPLGQTSNVLAFAVVTTDDAGSYDVVVSNVAGSVTSSPPALLTVNVPPVITVLPTNQTTNEGAAASFSVTATGTAPLSYQWRKAGAPLNGQTNDMLAIAVVTTNDAGSYDVVVSNVAGSVTSSPPALLSVNVPPVITVLPASQTTSAGRTVSLSVTATGTAPLSYQWRKAGVLLDGQTNNVLAFSPAGTNDTGNYDVVVSNIAGSVTSSPPALLAVSIPPTDPMRADALVIVNSASSRYLDFRNNIQPYLNNFGVPYSVIDIKTNAVSTNIAQHALIIIGHRELDTNHLYFDTAAQIELSLAVSNGVGLVNFDHSLSGGGVSSNYTFVQDIFGFTYASNSISSSAITFPATEVSNQLHYITALHSTNVSVSIRSNLVLAGLTFPTNVTALALRGTNPLIMVTSYGQGRAVQWGGYNWMTMAVKGPMAGLDDLVWRSLVWAARKPFVLRGMPNHVVLRVDDVAGPTAAASSSTALTNWVRIATETGFKPHLELFYNCLDQGEISVIRNAVTNSQATASIHSQGCGGGSFFYFDHLGKKSWPDDTMAQNFSVGTQWLQANGIPHAKTMCPHYSEVGTNIFAGLKAWGVEFTSIEIVPGQVEYTTPGAPWLVAGPYRLYETPLEGQSIHPFFYADFLPIPNHPELNGQFFNCYTEIRDDSACAEWCPDNNVTNSIAMGVRQLKRGFDSMAMATLFTHDYFFYPTVDNGSMAGSGPITTNNWRSILQGITNGIAGYNPQYVTIDYACQYVRATRTAQLTNAVYDPITGEVQLGLSGKSDLQLQIQVFVGEGNAISNRPAFVPAFTNSISVFAPVVDVPPTITLQPQDVAVVVGANVTLAVSATGMSPLAYQWRFNDTNIDLATNASLTINSVQLTNEGMYEVVVTNLLGAATSSGALLTVLIPPAVTNQPQSQTVTAGTPLVLAVGATGTEPMTYQWQHEGADVPEATNALFSLPVVPLAAAGLYSVQVSNAAGVAVSSNALLTVALPETVLQGSIRPSSFAISFNTTPGGSYAVEYTTNLPAVSWVTLSNLIAMETNSTVFDTLEDASRFYRVRLGEGSPESALLAAGVSSPQFLLSFNAVTGATYTVEYSGNLSNWQSLANFTAHRTNMVYPDPLVKSQRYYRVSTPVN